MLTHFAKLVAAIAISASGFTPTALVADDVLLLPPQEIPTQWTFEDWKTDFLKATIPYQDVTNVIGRDSIPSIDDPQFAPAANDTIIPRHEPVIALEIDGDARAYPLRILMWHEIVNDVVGGRDVAVTYCPLCNTSIVFDRKIDGETVTFGTTGKLRNSDLIMYDRPSHTWWQQFDGNALAGIHAGKKLISIPSRLMSLKLFLEDYPGGKMLLPDPRRLSQLGRNPYGGYDSAERPFLFRGEMPKDINGMVRVILVQGDEPFAVALPKLSDEGEFVANDLTFTWQSGQSSALDSGMIANGRDVGNIDVRDKDGNLVAHEITFAFAARAFLPDLEIIQ